MRWATTAALGAATGYLLWRLLERPDPLSPVDEAAAAEGKLRAGLDKLLAAARRGGDAHIDLTAKTLHAVLGDGGPPRHMALCCHIMRNALGPDDFVVREPRSGAGPTLTLRYHLGPA